MEDNIEDVKKIDTLVKTTIDWSVEHEKILVEWADKAMCYRWLHSKSNGMYSSLNTWYTIPVIIISTLTGTANFAQQRVPPAYQGYFGMLVGTFNIIAGIITTIQQFLKITQLNEAHRVASIAWGKFYRNLKIELAKHPRERIDVQQMIKNSKEEYDRLMETSPNIPEKIINIFKKSFNKSLSFGKIFKPEICDGLVPTNEFINTWSSAENITKKINNIVKFQNDKENEIKNNYELNKNIVSEFILSFKKINNRNPIESEITDNLCDKIDRDILIKIIENTKTNVKVIQNTDEML